MNRLIRKRALGAVVVLGLATAAAAVPAGANALPKCGADHSTIASNSYAVVYGNANNGKAYVCVKATGKTTRLKGASPTDDQFALGGTYVAWSSGDTHSVVNVMHIPDRAIPNQFPYNTNDQIDRIVVKKDGAVAWTATPLGDLTYVEGMDRRNHAPDQLSDDTEDVIGTSLRSGPGHTITWKDSDGSTHSASLF